MTAAAIATVLGGRKTLKRTVKSDMDLRVVTREGIPVATLPQLAQKLGVDLKTLAKVVGISDRTLSRRIAANARLTLEESDRTMRVARVFARAEDVLGASEKAARWMQSPVLALADHTPLELLDTDLGAQWVTDVLGRIEWGVYS
ncbi:putative toxin-antitoxin system antitoxin component, TIGR02293 family [Bryocella elongata]|uniref:Putative toxin-antitoxin system antitoxin component, TIGR02293 family n=1 Tax=Bryocella elongata TaxID=863522 RepID=A0A1H6BGB2_9BACT|nr:antitoxin Xre/MbcA/ParS toxin-binding domain-containing protein [Bryocella elongata]SEG59808.1 putative toxin-antitoxin system antitoxin component, TIGR02293 family [Bryocella elongata]